MKRVLPVTIGLALAITGCSKAPEAGDARDMAQDAPQQMAYAYRYGFDLPEAALAAAQARHVAMCDRLGRPRCRVLTTHRSAGEGSAGGSVTMEVAAGIARRFGEQLTAPVEALGGSLRSSDVEAEDLGRRIVDGRARLKSKQMLVDRLNGLLATRNGPVADLVAAEKAVAEAQGELDAARTELAQATGRVSTSPLSIDYSTTRGFAAQVGDAVSAIGEVLTMSVVALIYFVSFALPWAGLAGLVFIGVRALRRKRGARRTVVAPASLEAAP